MTAIVRSSAFRRFSPKDRLKAELRAYLLGSVNFDRVRHISFRSDRRRGMAAIWTLVVLAVLTGMMAAITKQLMSNRRWLDQRQNQMQTVWLARAGVELAADRLMAKPANYTGETVELIPAAQVRIEVRREPNLPNTFVVTSEARYPTDGRPLVVRSVTRRLRRTIEKDQVRMEVVVPDVPVKKDGGKPPKEEED